MEPITLRITGCEANRDEITLHGANRNGTATVKITTDELYAKVLSKLKTGDVLRIIEGAFQENDGLRLKSPDLEILEGPARDEWIQQDLENPAATDALKVIVAMVDSIICPLLKETCKEFLKRFDAPMRMTAAAKKFHHARRGGLAEHTAGMMKLADAICTTVECNRDLLLAGILFHDSGKLFEHLEHIESREVQPNLQGELLGHITAGILLANKCADAAVNTLGVAQTNHAQETRVHLLHLIASHHGKAEWGSPIPPKTREAFLLHSLDMIDAHLDIYETATQAPPEFTSPTGTTLHPRVAPLTNNVASSLPSQPPPTKP